MSIGDWKFVVTNHINTLMLVAVIEASGSKQQNYLHKQAVTKSSASF